MTERPAERIAELFRTGNYTEVALIGDESRLETWAARAMIGLCDQALEGLARWDEPEARFYEGVAHWLRRREGKARKALEAAGTPHAKSLLALIKKSRIDVLAFLPTTGEPPHDLLAVRQADKKFRVRQVGFHESDGDYAPYTPVAELVRGRTPDFVIAEMVEWQLLPTDLPSLPCPLLGHTADFDLHVQALAPWLEAFDTVLVTDQTEWADTRKICSRPVVTYPKVFGIADKPPRLGEEQRPWDLFQSGSMLHPYHPDKARLIDGLLDAEDLEIRFIDGFLSSAEYLRCLERAKCAFTFVRHGGATPTRGLDALAMGSAVVTQEGSTLTLFAGEAEGVLTYDDSPEDLKRQIRRVIAEWEHFEPAARRGAARIREHFAMRRVASEYFRFLTVEAARPRGARPALARPLEQKRPVLWKGWMPSGASHAELKLLRQENFLKLESRLREQSSPTVLIDVMREMLLEYVSVVRNWGFVPVNEAFLRQIFSVMALARRLFPDDLVLRFFFVRLAFHYGGAGEVSAAQALCDETFARDAASWKAPAMHDVLPWDFFSAHFDYRAYFDAIVEGGDVGGDGNRGGDGERAERQRVTLLLGGLKHYAGLMRRDPALLDEAARLVPEFPYYRFAAARESLAGGGAGERDAALRWLRELARKDIRVRTRALEELAQAGVEDDAELAALRARLERMPRSAGGDFERQDIRGGVLPPTMRIPPRGTKPMAWRAFSETAEEIGVAERHSSAGHDARSYRVSAIVSTYRSARFLESLFEDLAAQTLGDAIEIVVVDAGSPENEREIALRWLEKLDNVLYIRTTERESSHASISRAIRASRGEYLTLANTDDRHRPDALERMAAVLDARPDVGLVYPDSHVTPHENQRFADFAGVSHLEPPPYSEGLLLDRCICGPQPMWRRRLHEVYGELDASIESAGDWEFWLRVSETEQFLRIDEILGLYLYSPTSSERRDPERRQREIEHIQELYAPRVRAHEERRRAGLLRRVSSDAPLLVAVRQQAATEGIRQTVERLRQTPAEDTEIHLRLARADESIPENELGVVTTPGTPTLAELLADGTVWQYATLILVPEGQALAEGWLDRAEEALSRSAGWACLGEDGSAVAPTGPGLPLLAIDARRVHEVGGYRPDQPLDALLERLTMRFGGG